MTNAAVRAHFRGVLVGELLRHPRGEHLRGQGDPVALLADATAFGVVTSESLGTAVLGEGTTLAVGEWTAAIRLAPVQWVTVATAF